MKITYAVTVCNEFLEIQRLLNFLLKNKRPQDGVVVLYDSKNGDPEIELFLRAKSVNKSFAWHKAHQKSDGQCLNHTGFGLAVDRLVQISSLFKQ